MADDNTSEPVEQTTTKQEHQSPGNPTGKGGFGDHPEFINRKGWLGINTQKHWLSAFLKMSTKELKQWDDNTPDEMKTVAMSLAYARVVKSRDDLANYREVADRTEGKAVQPLEHSGDVSIFLDQDLLKKDE